MRISDWSSDVCSSDLTEKGDADAGNRDAATEDPALVFRGAKLFAPVQQRCRRRAIVTPGHGRSLPSTAPSTRRRDRRYDIGQSDCGGGKSGLYRRAAAASAGGWRTRSEEHTSELQSLMRISYAVFCLKKQRNNNITTTQHFTTTHTQLY